MELGSSTSSIIHHTSLSKPWKLVVLTDSLLALPRANRYGYKLISLVGVGIGLLCLISSWLALAVVLGVIVIIVALRRPVVLCYLMVASIALTSGVERGRLFPLLRPNEVGLLFSAGIAFLAILANKHWHVHISGYITIGFIVLISGTVIIPVIAYLVRVTNLATSDLVRLLGPLQYLLLFWLFAVLPESALDRRKLVFWMLLCGSIVAVVGLMQAARVGFVMELLDRWYVSSHELQAAAAGRVTSLMAVWNGLGIFLMVNLLIAWAILPSVKKLRWRIATILSMALFMACLVASGSYAGMLGLIMGILAMELLTRRGIRALSIHVLGVAVVVAAILLFQPFIQPLVQQRFDYQFRYGETMPQTLLFRLRVWNEVFWPVIRQHFLLGVHPTVPPTYAWQAFESQYIYLLFSIGLVGLLAHLTWVGIMLGWLYRSFCRLNGFLRAMVACTLTVLVVLSFAGSTNEVFTFSGVADYLWIMIGLVAGSDKVL